jgi:hypothetical protein
MRHISSTLSTASEGVGIDAARGTAPEDVILGTDADSESAQYLGTWYEVEQAHPDSLEEWFDDQTDTVKQVLLADDHIREWNDAR